MTKKLWRFFEYRKCLGVEFFNKRWLEEIVLRPGPNSLEDAVGEGGGEMVLVLEDSHLAAVTFANTKRKEVQRTCLCRSLKRALIILEAGNQVMRKGLKGKVHG